MIKKIILATIAVLVATGGYARDLSGETRTTAQSLYKPSADNPVRTILNIGNWGYWQRDNGESAHAPSGDSGGFFPRGTAAAIYLDGVLVGGYQNGLLRVSGQSHFMGTEPGYIMDGQHMTPGLDPRVRIYRIRKDYATLTADQVRQDAQELNELASLGDVTQGMIDKILEQYQADWDEWPTELGAPFYDLNGNGVYEPDQGETPGIANADQVIWYVITDADKGTTNGFYGTDPIGIEIQMTLWAYNQPGASLGQLLFKQIRIINKGDGDLTDAYITLFSDPDVGDYTNDLIGVDVDLSMMYVYNGVTTDDQYAEFGLAPPAAGYDFLAGPVVKAEGETAIKDLKRIEGWRNLPASSFGYYGDAENSDPQPQGEVESARKYYNLMRGFRPFDDLDNPVPWLDENGNPSKFIYSGDPVTGTGHLDSSPGDRRMLINSGPFTLEEGATQDIVVGVVGGLGDNNLSSITALRNNDVIVQQLFDDLFQSVPASPPGPVVKAVAMDDHVILDWGSDQTTVNATENSNIAGYEFQGYNVYQLPSSNASKDQATRIATFDKADGVGTIYGKKFLAEYGENVLIPVQFGLDKGVARQIKIDRDHLTGEPFNRGSEYYFAVTAYNYNPAPALIEDQALETSILALRVVPTDAPLDTEYGAEAGDAIETTHPEGPSDGSLTVTVIDPTKLTGHDYDVFFTDEEYYLDVDGIWKNTNAAGKEALEKILDCSGSMITVSALASETVGTYDLTFNFDMQCGSNWVDGIKLMFPAGVVVNSWAPLAGANYGQDPAGLVGTFDAATNTLMYGDDSRSTFGAIEGSQSWVVNIQPAAFPIDVGYTVYDDVYDGTQVDATGTASATELGYAYKTISGWYVRDINTGQIVTPHSTQQGTVAADNIVGGVFVPAHTAGLTEAPTFDGLQALVNGPEIGVKSVSETDQDDNVLDANVGVYPPSLGTTGYILSHRAHTGSTGRDHDRFDFWNMDDLIINFNETSLAWDYINEDVNGEVPFSIYRVKFPSGEHVRLFAGYWESDDIDGWSNSDAWQDYGRNSYEPIYAWQGYDAAGNEIQYDPANDAQYLADNALLTSANVTWGASTGEFNYPFVTATLLVTYLDGSTPPWGNKIWIRTNKANTAADKFAFTAPSNTVSQDLAKEAVKMVNVYPNPYYAGNSQETNRFDNFVTFTHLPQTATIKIFTLDGKIVRELEKDTESQFFKWDLRNHTDLPVASGLYIAHIDMGDLGEKVLKLAIVQPNQVIQYY